MSDTRHFHAKYHALGLQRNPFISIPPIARYDQLMHSLFCVRDPEVEQVCLRALQGSAIFVNAPYGGGKTVVVLEALSRLRSQSVVAVYAQFDRQLGFRQSLYNGMTSSGATLPGGDPMTSVRTVVRRISENDQKIVLIVDDLDRAADLSEIIEVTHDVRDVLSDGGSMVVTGQPFGVTYDLHTSAGGIFHEVSLPEFDESDFFEMLCKYLGSVQTAKHSEATHPLDEQSARFICREVAKAKLTPRLFNFAMSELIDLAALRDLDSVSFEFTFVHWEGLAQRIVRGLTSIQLRHIKAILEAGRVSEDTPQVINELGESPLSEYPDVVQSVLRPLLEKNLVQVQVFEGKESFRLTPHAASAVDDLFGDASYDPTRFEELIDALEACAGATSTHEKGITLEKFAILFLKAVPGFKIPDDGPRLRTETEELDVVVEIPDYRHQFRYGPLTICECKNWSKHIEGTALASFRDKLKLRKCTFGIFISLGGVTPGFRQKMKEYLADGIVIALLTSVELKRLEQRITPARILSDAYYTTVKYRGEEGA